jgi:SAM-dependent methyltransferase
MPRIAPSRRIPPLQLSQLEDRMQAYYAAVPDYPAFHTPSDHPLEWRHVLAEVSRLKGSNQEPVAILEFGSGRSGFPCWMRQKLGSDSPTSAFITCQDVTATNQTYLQTVADQVLIGPLDQSALPPARFDIIFSTHCFEHVARPEALLHTCITLLKPGGTLLLFAPRYDLPFYLSPSSVDLRPVSRLLLGLRLMWIRMVSRLRGKPAFVIDTAPACLDRPFVRDADAIHWVSEQDVQLFARRHGLSLSRLNVSHHAAPPSKQWLIDQFGKLAVCLQKPLQTH